MSLFSEGMTAALSAIFALVLILVTQYYKHVKVVSEKYEEASELVSATVLTFRSELQQQSKQLSDMSNEVVVLKSVKAKERVSQFDEVISDLGELKERLSQMERATGLSSQELIDLKESFENLSKMQGEVKTEIDALNERYRGLLPENEAREIVPIVSNTSLSRLHLTEQEILHMLITEGPKPATEIQRRIGKTREHAARLMRKLYDQGLVMREEDKRPYIYTVSDKVRELVKEPVDESKSSETSNQ